MSLQMMRILALYLMVNSDGRSERHIGCRYRSFRLKVKIGPSGLFFTLFIMTKEEYKELLLSPEWADKRLSIYKRDLFCCQKCGSKSHLNCHHKYYLEGRKPWQYPSSALITLCESCHTTIHKTTKIGRKSKKKKGQSSVPKNERRVKRLMSELNIKERATQVRYDKLNKG